MDFNEVWAWLREQTQDAEASGWQHGEVIATPELGKPPSGLSRPKGFLKCGTFSAKPGQSWENQDQVDTLCRAGDTGGRSGVTR